MQRILIVYQNIQHYRIPIFSELMKEESHGLQYTIAADVASKNDIKTVDESILCETPTPGRLTFLRLKNHWKGNYLWQSGLIKAILSGKFDTFIFLGDAHYASTWVGVVLARLLGKQTYYWAHGFICGRSFQDMLKHLFFRLPHGLFLYGERAKENLIRLGFQADHLHVIYNSLDYETQLTIRPTLTDEKLTATKQSLFSNDYPVLFFIGRLTAQKKLHALVELVKQLHISGVPSNLLFIGDGSERQNLEELVDSENLRDFVSFYGSCHNEEEIAPLIAMSDLCIAPGEIGLTAMHSLVYGTPVITHGSYIHQMPEYEAVTPGLNGDYFEHGNFESLVETTIGWLQKSKNRAEIREACYKPIDEKFNPTNQAKVLRDTIRNTR